MASIVYPLRVENGRVLTTADYPVVVGQHIRHALETGLEELVMLPDYGLEDHTFDSLSSIPNLLSAARGAIAASLISGYPEVTYSLLGTATDEGTVTVTVEYTCGDVSPYTEVVTVGQ